MQENSKIRAIVVTVSDSRTVEDDSSGDVLIELLEGIGAEVVDSIILPQAGVEAGVKIKRAIIDAEVRLTRAKAEKVEAVRGKDKNAIIIVGKRKIQSSKEIEK